MVNAALKGRIECCAVYLSYASSNPALCSSIRLTDKTPKEYAVYRSPLLFWGLVDLVYDMFRVGLKIADTSVN